MNEGGKIERIASANWNGIGVGIGIKIGIEMKALRFRFYTNHFVYTGCKDRFDFFFF